MQSDVDYAPLDNQKCVYTHFFPIVNVIDLCFVDRLMLLNALSVHIGQCLYSVIRWLSSVFLKIIVVLADFVEALAPICAISSNFVNNLQIGAIGRRVCERYV